MEAVRESQPTKKGFFNRLRRSKTATIATEASKTEPVETPTDEGQHPSQTTGTQSQSATVTREGLPIISSSADGFKPSEVRQNNRRVKKRSNNGEEIRHFGEGSCRPRFCLWWTTSI